MGSWEPFNHKNFNNGEVKIIHDKNGEITKKSLTQCFESLKQLQKSEDLPLSVVYIDSASCLLKKCTLFQLSCKEGLTPIETNFYRIFRKNVRYTPFVRDYLISAASLISNLYPSKEDNPSWRDDLTDIKLLPPFNLVQNLDVFT